MENAGVVVGGQDGDRLEAIAARVALEAWCYGSGGARKRDVIWAVVVQEQSCREVAKSFGIDFSQVARWVRQYRTMASEVLPLCGVMIRE